MTAIQDFLNSVNPVKINEGRELEGNELGNQISFNWDEENKPQLALISVAEERGASNNEGCSAGADQIRKYFYRLKKGDYSIQIADLGEIKAGNSQTDTYFALKEVMKGIDESQCDSHRDWRKSRLNPCFIYGLWSVRANGEPSRY